MTRQVFSSSKQTKKQQGEESWNYSKPYAVNDLMLQVQLYILGAALKVSSYKLTKKILEHQAFEIYMAGFLFDVSNAEAAGNY